MSLPALPWLYLYEIDLAAASRYARHGGREVLRPIVEVSLVGKHPMEQKAKALVDSGSEHILAAPWIGRAAGVDPEDALYEITLGIGGDNVVVRFVPATLRLHPPGESEIEDYVDWDIEVGLVDRNWRASWSLVVGQVGFFDHLTVTMHRDAQAVVVDRFEDFDERFGPQLRAAELHRPQDREPLPPV